MCTLVSLSVEHEEAQLMGGVRAVVMDSQYLIEPCGSGKSRLTHICRVDLRWVWAPGGGRHRAFFPIWPLLLCPFLLLTINTLSRWLRIIPLTSRSSRAKILTFRRRSHARLYFPFCPTWTVLLSRGKRQHWRLAHSRCSGNTSPLMFLSSLSLFCSLQLPSYEKELI